MPGFNIAGASSSSQPDAKLSAVGDAHRSFRWRLVQTVGISLNDFNVYAKSLTPPTYTVNEEQVDGASVKYKFAGSINWEDVSITFYDVYGLMDQLFKLYNNIWDPSIGLLPAANYMGDTIFELVDGDGNRIDQWTLKNSWIKSMSHSDLDYSSNELKTVSLTVAYSWAEFRGSTQGDSSSGITRTENPIIGRVVYTKDE